MGIAGDIDVDTGLNAEGLWLHVHTMHAADTSTPGKPCLSWLFWAREALETCATIDDVEPMLGRIDRDRGMILVLVEGRTQPGGLRVRSLDPSHDSGLGFGAPRTIRRESTPSVPSVSRVHARTGRSAGVPRSRRSPHEHTSGTRRRTCSTPWPPPGWRCGRPRRCGRSMPPSAVRRSARRGSARAPRRRRAGAPGPAFRLFGADPNRTRNESSGLIKAIPSPMASSPRRGSAARPSSRTRFSEYRAARRAAGKAHSDQPGKGMDQLRAPEHDEKSRRSRSFATLAKAFWGVLGATGTCSTRRWAR